MILQIDRQTGYPSVDKPWLKYYEELTDIGIELINQEILWDVIERKLRDHNDVPAIEYFGRIISRAELIKMVYTWVRVFTNMGVKKGAVVPIYGCLTPDIVAITFALNYIGAVPYFLKLAMSQESLGEETREAEYAVVFAGMWNNVCEEFTKEKYKKVIVYDIWDAMKQPQQSIIRITNKLKKQNIIKYNIRVSSVKSILRAYDYPCETAKALFEAGKPAFITSSSGTTIGGVVKGTVATNEATLAQLYMVTASGTLCTKGDRALNNLPPTAATSLNLLLFLPLFRGATIIIDPRISQDNFYDQIIKYKPNFILTTGSFWETFFDKVEQNLLQGVKYDFWYTKGWMVGGEGSDPRKYDRWNKLLLANGSLNPMLSGYGCSEVFSSISVDTLEAQSNHECNLPVMGVGIPLFGATLGVFDADGKELNYNQRGELWISSVSAMKGYYGKPELTKGVLIDGWIHTGDLAQISEDGFLYIWGRMKDCIETASGKVFLFDIVNEVKKDAEVAEAIVINSSEDDRAHRLFIHLEWAREMPEEERNVRIQQIDANLKEVLPADVEVAAYAEHEKIPFSPTTLKKDKNKLAEQRDGYFRVENNTRIEIGK